MAAALAKLIDGKEADMAASAPVSAREQVRPVAPKLVELAETVVYGEVWERPGLSKRDRSLITVATLIALEHDPKSLNQKVIFTHWVL
jgi:4-carboxymuconolactone decarboxylase